MEIDKLKIGFIGGGAMAENILRGVLSSKLLCAEQIMVSDINAKRLKHLKDAFAVKTTLDNSVVASQSDLLLLAVKPQSLKVLLKEINSEVNEKKLFLSIAAGVKSQTISGCLSGKGRIIRIMPNISATVLESASALCMGPFATGDDLNVAKKFFGAIGKTVVVDESLMDAVTGLSGSGPAYIFLIIEAMTDAGVMSGLSRSTALRLAAQTCYGAAKLVLEKEQTPASLKDLVTSPGGTTIAGIHVLEKGSVRGTIMDAVAAAVSRSKELGTDKP
ncbi:MAG: pyrroline-5-carboxylate reductase [Alphaproteobacteria bacterium]